MMVGCVNNKSKRFDRFKNKCFGFLSHLTYHCFIKFLKSDEQAFFCDL